MYTSPSLSSRSVSVVAVLLLTIALVLGSAWSARAATDGDFTFDVNSDGVTATITGYTGNTALLVIPPTVSDGVDSYPVTHIGSGAFSGNTAVEIALPEGLQSIGQAAFSGTQATTIHFPSSLKTIDQYGFAASKVQVVALPEGFETIGTGAFIARQVEVVSLPSTLTVVPMSAFAGVTSLRELTLGAGVEVISETAFAGGSLTSVSIPSSVRSIDAYAFAGNDINEVTFAEGIEEVRGHAFGSNPLTNVKIPATVNFIGDRAFDSLSGYATFLGDAPTITAGGATGSFGNVQLEPQIRYIEGRTGFSSPMWQGYHTQLLHEITFDAGSSISVELIVSGEAASQPANPTRTGYDFAGWALSSGELFDFATPIAQNIALAATWTVRPPAGGNTGGGAGNGGARGSASGEELADSGFNASGAVVAVALVAIAGVIMSARRRLI